MTDTAELTGIVPVLEESVYHAHPALSSTGARMLLDSPARFHYNQTHPRAGKDAWDLGTAVHTKVLGVGHNVTTYPPEHLTPSGNASTKAATVAWVEEQRANGLVVVPEAQFRLVDGMSEAVLAHREGRAVLEATTGREVSLFAEVDGVAMRARFDIYGDNKGADLKTTRDVSPKGFNREVGSYGYHIQDRWYADTHEAITGTELDWFKFVAVENKAPYLVAVYDLDFMWEDLAKQQTVRARELYRRCIETNTWPGYASATLTPPTWAVFESEETEIEV